MQAPPAHTAFASTNGPTSVAKGFVHKLVKTSTRGLVEAGFSLRDISIGQAIRDKMETDETFRRLHGDVVRRGDLVSDEVAIQIFSEALERILEEGEPDVIIIDGFYRSVTQVQFGLQNGLLRKQDQFYFIEADLKTCLERFLHRTKANSARVDSEVATFHYRYHLHRRTVGDLRALLLDSPDTPQIIDIDANRQPGDGDDFIKCIPEVVHPAFLSTFLPLAFRQMAARKAVLA